MSCRTKYPYMTSDEKMEQRKWRHNHGGHFLIPAGVLIGLGIGLIAGYVASGILIGLGCGLIASALAWNLGTESQPETSGTATVSGPGHCCCGGARWGQFIVGLFMILIGVGIGWAPPFSWTYLVAAFVILLGIWIAARGMWRRG